MNQLAVHEPPQIAVKSRPIPFSGEMVRAIIEGRKRMPRRVVKPQPDESMEAIWRRFPRQSGCPYGKPGDHLWVRENMIRPDGDPWLYAADSQPVMVNAEDETSMLVWAHHKRQDYCPSIYMPRWASRITLEITDVRVERVQDISEEDAMAEGVEPYSMTTAEIADTQISDCSPAEKELVRLMGPGSFSNRFEFQMLWDSINAKREGGIYSWAKNPFVWCVSFRMIQ